MRHLSDYEKLDIEFLILEMTLTTPDHILVWVFSCI